MLAVENRSEENTQLSMGKTFASVEGALGY